ncbi:uncharacterized protein METZ01_LOCUS119546 [marine metagenome]|uniref:Uncharacterized protein n=1 Tax=marine metagenome TaxID=408172 RepID=A0A381XQC3_9ZZZZ
MSLTIADLNLVVQIIDIATQRGAFRAPELKMVGELYDKTQEFLKEVAEQQQAQGEDGGTESADEATAAATALTGEPPLTGGEPPTKSKAN